MFYIHFIVLSTLCMPLYLYVFLIHCHCQHQPQQLQYRHTAISLQQLIALQPCSWSRRNLCFCLYFSFFIVSVNVVVVYELRTFFFQMTSSASGFLPTHSHTSPLITMLTNLSRPCCCLLALALASATTFLYMHLFYIFFLCLLEILLFTISAVRRRLQLALWLLSFALSFVEVLHFHTLRKHAACYT